MPDAPPAPRASALAPSGFASTPPPSVKGTNPGVTSTARDTVEPGLGATAPSETPRASSPSAPNAISETRIGPDEPGNVSASVCATAVAGSIDQVAPSGG